jgi:glycosyltransferase involved in cell wall biosynthesis
MLELFPLADVYIPLIGQPYLDKLQQKHRVYTSPLNLILPPEKYVSWLKPLVLMYWAGLNLGKYDLVISSSHSFSAKSVKVNPPTKHLAYLHTSPRYLYREFNEMSWLKKAPFKWFFSGVLGWLRKKDFEAAQQVDVLIANSKTTQARIKRYYHRSSQVIHPPVHLPVNQPRRANRPSYYLFHSRLVKQKGAALVIKAFNQLSKPLVVIGTGPEEKYLRKMAGKNITFLGFVLDEQLAQVYLKAKALVYASIDEDLGLVPVEAMAHGVPVIAYNSGGVKETVVHNKTGLLFRQFSLKSLKKAVLKFEKRRWSAKNCHQQAQKFAEEKFQQQLLTVVLSLI